MKTWGEKLKHPKWQEKRLRILNRAGFACEDCGDQDTTLHVHHTYYDRGRDPWDYDDATLMCLCSRCHKTAHEKHRRVHEALGKCLAGGLYYYDEVLAHLHCLFIDKGGTVVPETDSWVEYSGIVASHFGIDVCGSDKWERFIDALIEKPIDSERMREIRGTFPRG